MSILVLSAWLKNPPLYSIFCQQRLSDADYVIKLENLVEETSENEHKQKLLKALYQYLQSL
ncbi:MAG TPA: hypothetical protein DDW91_12415 [Shewanella frigidimarina]|nr:hypothetical protein [Shewanella frigidimarina]